MRTAHAHAIASVEAPSRQAVLVEPRRLEIRDFTPPRPGPGELLIKIECALSCGTDLKTFRRGHPVWKLPTPFGHEFSGVVAEVGMGVRGFRPGDEIMAAPTAPCGTCFFCRRGQENLCAMAMEKMVFGAYADWLLLPAHVVALNTFIKPAELPFEEAALLEPLACVVYAQAMARPEKYETALIVGAGPFGLMHMLALKAAGVREVAVAGRGAHRLRWAGEMGADRVIDVCKDDADRRRHAAQRRLRSRPGNRMHRPARRMAGRAGARPARRAGGIFRRMSGGNGAQRRYAPDALRQPDSAGAVSLPAAATSSTPSICSPARASARARSSTRACALTNWPRCSRCSNADGPEVRGHSLSAQA